MKKDLLDMLEELFGLQNVKNYQTAKNVLKGEANQARGNKAREVLFNIVVEAYRANASVSKYLPEETKAFNDKLIQQTIDTQDYSEDGEIYGILGMIYNDSASAILNATLEEIKPALIELVKEVAFHTVEKQLSELEDVIAVEDKIKVFRSALMEVLLTLRTKAHINAKIKTGNRHLSEPAKKRIDSIIDMSKRITDALGEEATIDDIATFKKEFLRLIDIEKKMSQMIQRQQEDRPLANANSNRTTNRPNATDPRDAQRRDYLANITRELQNIDADFAKNFGNTILEDDYTADYGTGSGYNWTASGPSTSGTGSSSATSHSRPTGPSKYDSDYDWGSKYDDLGSTGTAGTTPDDYEDDYEEDNFTTPTGPTTGTNGNNNTTSSNGNNGTNNTTSPTGSTRRGNMTSPTGNTLNNPIPIANPKKKILKRIIIGGVAVLLTVAIATGIYFLVKNLSKDVKDPNPNPNATPAPTLSVDEFIGHLGEAQGTIHENWQAQGSDISENQIAEVIKALNNVESTYTAEEAYAILIDTINHSVEPAVNNMYTGSNEPVQRLDFASLVIGDKVGLEAVRRMEANLNGCITDPANAKTYIENALADIAHIIGEGESLYGMDVSADTITDPGLRIIWASLGLAIRPFAGPVDGDITVTIGNTIYNQTDIEDGQRLIAVIEAAQRELGISPQVLVK